MVPAKIGLLTCPGAAEGIGITGDDRSKEIVGGQSIPCSDDLSRSPEQMIVCQLLRGILSEKWETKSARLMDGNPRVVGHRLGRIRRPRALGKSFSLQRRLEDVGFDLQPVHGQFNREPTGTRRRSSAWPRLFGKYDWVPVKNSDRRGRDSRWLR